MIWLIGCNGMLGKEISDLFSAKGLDFIGTDRDCDITDIESLRSFAQGKGFSWIINCSAYTAVDKAEDEESLAFKINADGAGNIAKIASEIGAKMIHISTDYVFAGNGAKPYAETDPVGPAGAYGRTKLAGEAQVSENCPQNFIIRTAWLYGQHGNNFVHTMLRLMAEKDSLNVVCDQKGSPTWAFDLSSAIVSIIEQNSESYGIYHFTDGGETNWHEFACTIRGMALEKGLLSRNVPVNPVTSDQYPTKAVRPAYSVLDKTKIKTVMGISIPMWNDSLNRFLDQKVNGL